MFSVARPPKLFHIPSNGSLKGCLIALVGLLTLRLPSLGWLLTRLRHFYFISLVCLRYPLSFVLFCFFRCPAQGLAACRYFLFKLSFRFFQIDLLAQLNARIKALEDAGNDVPAHLSKITSYGFRREEDFDKYDALNMAEQLATAAKLSGHEKASTYDAIACTLREKLPFNKKQFEAYFVALLADKEYAKVLEAVAKVDKSFKSSVPRYRFWLHRGSRPGICSSTPQTSKDLLLYVWCAWSHGVQMLQTVQYPKLPTVAASPPYAASWRTIVYLFLARCALLCTINKGHSFLSIVVFCSVYFVFLLLFLFFPLSLFILFSVIWGYKVSSIRTLFIFFVPFSYLSYFLRIFRLRFLFLISVLFFSSLLSSVSNSPTKTAI